MSTREPGVSAPRDRSDEVWARAADGFARWRGGDESGLHQVVAVMTPVLWHVVRSYRLPSDTAEDVIQTTWLSFMRHHASIKDSDYVGGWLTMSARREAWRVSRLSTKVTPVDVTSFEVRMPSQRSAESVAVEADRDKRLWQAVQSLSERCQRLLRIVAFDRRPDYKAVAESLGMPIGSIGPTRGRCLTKLRVALGDAAREEEY